MEKEILVEKDQVFKLIKENIYSCVVDKIELDDRKYHHNTKIESVSGILKTGLLSTRARRRLFDKRELTDEEEYKLEDEFYVNGADHISLSSMDVDFSQKYKDEDVYNPYYTASPDIIISKDIETYWNPTNYYNEYLVNEKIPVELFKSIEVKIFKAMEKRDTKAVLEYYNEIRKIALVLKELNLDIPVRESSLVTSMDNENIEALTLSKEKLINLPEIKIK